MYHGASMRSDSFATAKRLGRSNWEPRTALRIVNRGVHACAPRCFLHLEERPSLFIEAQLDLHYLLHLPGLATAARPVKLGASVRGLHRCIKLIDARLEICHLLLLCQDPRSPLLGCSLLRKRLLHGAVI